MGRKTSALMEQALKLANKIAKQIVHEQQGNLMQMCKDIATITAHRTLGMGPGRAGEFLKVYDEVATEVAQLFVDDSADDKELWYSKARLDEQLLEIVGPENFAPHDERYNK